MANAARFQKPPGQRIGQGRVNLIKFAALVAAVALVVFDAKVS